MVIVYSLIIAAAIFLFAAILVNELVEKHKKDAQHKDWTPDS